MRVFLIHRFDSRRAALRVLKDISSKDNISLNPIVLDSFGGSAWKSEALNALEECEAAVVFDIVSCRESENTSWEIAQARKRNKPIILIDPERTDADERDKLFKLYNGDEEFDSLFSRDGENTEMLYKMMVGSSEQLVQRRQRMNAFFITAIGSLLAISVALAKFGIFDSQMTSFFVIPVFAITGLLLCNSWQKLIDNYGKLNTAKFRVILQLERSLSAQIFSAEWVALGKGRRLRKYQSFTSTENSVPLWFATLIFSLVILALVWKIWG